MRIILIIVGVALAFWALHRLASVVLVSMVAALFAYVIAPLVQLAERPIRIVGRPRRLSRAAAIAVVYVLMADSVSGGAVLLLPSATEQANDMIVRAPAYAQSILAWDHGWSRYYERVRIPLELRQSIDRSVLAAARPLSNQFKDRCRRSWALSVPTLARFDPHPCGLAGDTKVSFWRASLLNYGIFFVGPLGYAMPRPISISVSGT